MKQKFSKIVLNEIIMDSMPGLSYIFSKEGNLVAWGSRKAWDMLEYSDEEMNNKLVIEFIDDADKEKVMTAFQKVFIKGETQVEHLAVSKSGKRIPLLASARLVKIEDEEFLIGLSVDISELVNARDKIEEHLKEISRLNELLKAENIYLKDQLMMSGVEHEMVGESDALKYILYKIQQVAPTDATVLIQGETGTGKELVARAIHNESKRKNKPFVKVNCASIPENLIESELFGHEKGAFTGAIEKRIGRFELADGGTIFLDEIGELPINVQSKLLHVLQQGEFERIGSSKTIRADVRVIAATNKVLQEEIEKGNFRNDLYYRLNVFPISVVPLREKKEDIPLLIEHYIQIYSDKFNKPIKSIPKNMIKSFVEYHWPGNIRELENMVERAIITSQNGNLNFELLTKPETIVPEELPLETMEKNHILKVLEKTYWRISGKGGAASLLKINPDTLRSKMRKLGIKRNTTD
ncbi:MAG: sigma 54-interacting transcriptional regulator [Ignavibacteriaceae bacterium]|nr:sigma 54-interacting transcriptional regulator [Ignavibacteriaceae bacterium]